MVLCLLTQMAWWPISIGGPFVAIVKIKTKYGVYVYDSIAKWDPKLKQSRPIRKYLGKLGPSGEIIPTGGKRGRKPKANVECSDQSISACDKYSDAEINEIISENQQIKTENINLRIEVSELTSRAKKAESALNSLLNSLRTLVGSAEKKQEIQ